MFNIFLILHAILAIVLILSVLLQRSDGGALGGLGGGANFLVCSKVEEVLIFLQNLLQL